MTECGFGSITAYPPFAGREELVVYRGAPVRNLDLLGSIQHPGSQGTQEVSRGCCTVNAEAGGKDKRGVLTDWSEPGGLGALSMWGLLGTLQGCGEKEDLR